MPDSNADIPFGNKGPAHGIAGKTGIAHVALPAGMDGAGVVFGSRIDWRFGLHGASLSLIKPAAIHPCISTLKRYGDTLVDY